MYDNHDNDMRFQEGVTVKPPHRDITRIVCAALHNFVNTIQDFGYSFIYRSLREIVTQQLKQSFLHHRNF